MSEVKRKRLKYHRKVCVYYYVVFECWCWKQMESRVKSNRINRNVNKEANTVDGRIRRARILSTTRRNHNLQSVVQSYFGRLVRKFQVPLFSVFLIISFFFVGYFYLENRSWFVYSVIFWKYFVYTTLFEETP